MKLIKLNDHDKLFTANDMINAFVQGTNSGACYESLMDYDSGDCEEAMEFAEAEIEKFKQYLIKQLELRISCQE
jgi:hypothetical protein